MGEKNIFSRHDKDKKEKGENKIFSTESEYIEKNDEVEEENEYGIISAQPKAVVVHCGDPRFQQAFQRFIHNELKLKAGEYVPLVIPGGISALAEPEALPKHFKVTKEQIEFFIEHMSTIKKVILINHEDCKAYEGLKGKIGNAFLKYAGSMIQRQQIDLGKVMKALLSLSSFKVNFKAYIAKFKDSEHTIVVFEEVTLK